MAATSIQDAGNKVRNLVADSTRDTMDSLKHQLGRLQDELADVQATADSYVRENPWKTAGFAALIAAVAVAVAMLASRRS